MITYLFVGECTYTREEIEQISGFKPTSFPGGYSVLGPDFTQYDFVGDPDCLKLVRVDGEDFPAPHPMAGPESGREIDNE